MEARIWILRFILKIVLMKGKLDIVGEAKY